MGSNKSLISNDNKWEQFHGELVMNDILFQFNCKWKQRMHWNQLISMQTSENRK